MNRMDKKRIILLWICMLLVSFNSAIHSRQVKRITIVPDSFLREYDPITIFFPDRVGPVTGGPLDRPGNLLKMEPNHPGEYRFLDSRTLIFYPTTAWPPLTEFKINVRNKRFKLHTFMSQPSAVLPVNKSRNLEPIHEIYLDFKQDIKINKLKEMIRFQVRSIPGVDDQKGIWLRPDDFILKKLERSTLKGDVKYRIQFNRAISYGQLLTLHLQLSRNRSLPDAVTRFNFRTKARFRIISIGCGRSEYPISSKGSSYAKDQALNCGTGKAPIFVRFSDSLGNLSLNEIKKMIHFEPSIRNFSYRIQGKKILLHFKMTRNKVYRLSLKHSGIQNISGRGLAKFGNSDLYFFYQPSKSYIKWQSSRGIMERYGPQTFPMEGRNIDKIDLRIYKIDGLDRNYWPLSDSPVMVDENKRPPGPGEEPPFATALRKQIRLLKTPLISRIINIPIQGKLNRSRFGLDLKPFFSEISGRDQAGTYLVGYRPINDSHKRYYIRIQVTDLCLSTVEEESAIRFFVSSYKDGIPIENADITVQGYHHRNQTWTDLIKGSTDSAGSFHYVHSKRISKTVGRIIVRKSGDLLVINTQRQQPFFKNNHWYGEYNRWLSWLNRHPRMTRSKPVVKAHVFTERPIYKPNETVHVKGYIRHIKEGRILKVKPKRKRHLRIDGPGNKSWEYKIFLNKYGSFYHPFKGENLPTGEYTVHVYDSYDNRSLAKVTFKKENYRIPRFELHLSGEDIVPLDKKFKMVLSARYYAGGMVSGQQTEWKISQYPYRHRAPNFRGFIFSSDKRFSESSEPLSRDIKLKQDITDENGLSAITIDPTIEQNSQPRQYLFEATVRGADEQSVTTTKRVIALPPVAIGLKMPRFVKSPENLKPAVIILNHRSEKIANREFQLKLFHRQWHSYLRQTDFTSGKAKYVNDIVDKLILKKTERSIDGIKHLTLPVQESGVYILQLSVQDKLGRIQKISADVYVAGSTAVAWKKPIRKVFETATDKKVYNPGETAKLILKSPFQKAMALVIVEEPSRNRYHWISIRKGQGVFKLPVRGDMYPRLPIHTMIMRGRIGQKNPKGSIEDRGKPITMANTTWIKVRPREKQLNISLDFPTKNLPGKKIQMTVKLKTPEGRICNGEVALWLVDRAVLALGKEKNLDPIRSFTIPVKSHIRIRGTRNDALGRISLLEYPGGGGEEGAEPSIFNKVTVRKNFKPVPYYNPMIQVIDGVAKVEIQLPDNLTDFAVRAVATDGLSRFGFAKSNLSIRLPLIIQSALPRFVRPGDRFKAGGIGRVVEGDGGPGGSEIEVKGLVLNGSHTREMNWIKNRAEKIFYPLSVPLKQKKHELKDVTIRMAVKRTSDEAMDAFEVKLPIIDEKEIHVLDLFKKISSDQIIRFPFPKPGEKIRKGSVLQSATLTSEPAILKMLTALNYLSTYQHHCTEQRISRLLPEMAYEDLFRTLGTVRKRKHIRHYMDETLKFLERCQSDNGLFSYWPGSRSYVSLTAYVIEFLIEAKKNGYVFKSGMLNRGIRGLKESLRSDYTHFIDGYSFVERAEALTALAKAGHFDDSYSNELMTRAQSMDLYSESKILVHLLDRKQKFLMGIDNLKQDLFKSLVFQLRNGKRVYRGLQYRARSFDGPIPSSEIKTASMVARALYMAEPDSKKIRPLFDEIISRGDGDGWGSTSANASALMALHQFIKKQISGRSNYRYRIDFGQGWQSGQTGGNAIWKVTGYSDVPARLQLLNDTSGKNPHVWLSTRYEYSGGIELYPARNNGFVVERMMKLYRKENAPPVKIKAEVGKKVHVPVGTIVEEQILVINPKKRYFVAIKAPFAAGFEPMNPNLATASSSAKPEGVLTRQPDYAIYGDDAVTFYFDELEKGTYHFYYRLKGHIEGSFVHPPAKAEMMYRLKTRGNSPGMRILIDSEKE